MLENSVFLNLKKYGDVKYYQKRKGAEIDFILTQTMSGFEVKETADLKEFDKLKRTAELLDLKEFYMVTENFNDSKGVIIAQTFKLL